MWFTFKFLELGLFWSCSPHTRSGCGAQIFPFSPLGLSHVRLGHGVLFLLGSPEQCDQHETWWKHDNSTRQTDEYLK